MLNFKEIKCIACNKIWNNEEILLDHYKSNHQELKESNFIKPETKIIKNGYAYNTFEKSLEYLKQFAENLILLRNRIPSAKQISLKSFTYYNQCIQKMIDRHSTDSNTSLKNILENLLNQNLIIKNSCHQCCISFRSLPEFKQHISKRYCKKRVRLVESGQFQPNQHLKCVQCDRIFGCKILLTHHIKSEHCSADVVPENCNKCMKSFQYRHEYNSHIRESCSYQIYCSICELLFETTDDFKSHTKVQHEIESKLNTKIRTIFNKKPRRMWKNKCCVCPKFYRNYEDLGKHFKTVHAEFQLKTCEYCGDNFVQNEELRTHVDNFHFKCTQNAQDAGVMNGSPRDMSQIHLCVECNLVFSTIEDLEQHRTIHKDELSYSRYTPSQDSLDSPLFTCDICVQTFNFEEELQQHKATNHDNTTQQKRMFTYHCTICRKKFNTNKSLVSHNVKMHSIKKKQNTSCFKCHKTFKNIKSINIHLKKNHCMPSTNIPKKPKLLNIKTDEIKTGVEDTGEFHSCIVCKKKFTSKKSLICHAKMHYLRFHGPNCEVCGEKCNSIEDLLNHFKSHPSKSLSILKNMNSNKNLRKFKKSINAQHVMHVNEHQCEICKRIFASKVGLSLHYSMKHHRVNKKHGCVICKETFSSKVELISHLQEHVDKHDKFTCMHCSEPYECDDYLLHMSNVHQTHTCIFCYRDLASHNSLMAHKASHYR